MLSLCPACRHTLAAEISFQIVIPFLFDTAHLDLSLIGECVRIDCIIKWLVVFNLSVLLIRCERSLSDWTFVGQSCILNLLRPLTLPHLSFVSVLSCPREPSRILSLSSLDFLSQFHCQWGGGILSVKHCTG